MDPFVVPRTTFTVYRKLVQFPFEVGLRLLGRGDGDRVEATADRADAAVVEKPRRRPAQRRRQAAAKSGQTASRRGRAASSRQRQTSRRGQAQRQTAARRRQAAEATTDAPERTETATEQQREAAIAHGEAETLRAMQDVQERIEAARREVGAGQGETPEQRPTEAAAPDEARDDTAGQEREHDGERPGAQGESAESAHHS